MRAAPTMATREEIDPVSDRSTSMNGKGTTSSRGNSERGTIHASSGFDPGGDPGAAP